MKLTSEAVETIFRDCLFKENEDAMDRIEVEGVVSKFGLHPGRIGGHRGSIIALLAQLPESFQLSKGGGHTFLNACMTKDDEQWTGEHRIMEQLFVLGMAIGKVKCLFDRSMWANLPGGVPYYRVDDGRVQ